MKLVGVQRKPIGKINSVHKQKEFDKLVGVQGKPIGKNNSVMR